MKVKAAVLHRIHEPLRIETLDLQDPAAGEVLVRIDAAGMCHSDLHIIDGASEHPLPVVPGHEGAGTVEAVGEGVRAVKPGDRVALNWAPFCGDCFQCRNDRPALCGTFVGPIWEGALMDGSPRWSLDGKPVRHYTAVSCFAERVVVHASSCVPMPGVEPEIAALVGCAVATGVGAALNTVTVPEGSSVLVWGAGGVGLGAILGARHAGAGRIIAVDVNEARCGLARTLGATETLLAPDVTAESIRDRTEGLGADYVFEAIGKPSVQEACLDVVRPGGTVVLVGLSPMGSATNLPGAVLTRREITVTGSYYGSTRAQRDFPRYAQLFGVDVARMIARRYTLDQVNEAVRDLQGPDAGRGVLRFR